MQTASEDIIMKTASVLEQFWGIKGRQMSIKSNNARAPAEKMDQAHHCSEK
jgi:hypothetical protein